MKAWFCAFFCSTTLLFSGMEMRLKERLEKGKSGDYIVTEANKMITVLVLRSSTKRSLVLEEISAPAQNLKNRPSSWIDWVKAKAPGHTSWSMIEMDPQSGQVMECYSFSRSAWIPMSQKESLFATLLDLPMKKVSPENLRKIGPPPLEGEPDFRKVWTPPLIFEGKALENAQFEVYETVWPEDDSELSNQQVSLYFDREKRSPLPFWVQVETSHVIASLRTIDSGKNLPVIYRSMPRRVPEFVGMPQKTEQGIRLHLKSPKYYRQFELFAVDVTTKEKQIYPLSHSLIQGDDELVTVVVDQEDLKQTLKPDHRYTWLLVPIGHTESYTESMKPFLWKKDSAISF